jgi:hypothetical protein
LQLTPTVLYRLADSRHRRGRSSLYTPQAIAAILAEAKETRVGIARADRIAMALRHQYGGVPATAGHKSDSGPAPIPRTPAVQAAVLPCDTALRAKFAAAIAELETLTTEPIGNFVGVAPADRLEMAANFVKQIAAASKRQHEHHAGSDRA